MIILFKYEKKDKIYPFFTNQILLTSQLLLEGAGFGIWSLISTGILNAPPKATQVPGGNIFIFFSNIATKI